MLTDNLKSITHQIPMNRTKNQQIMQEYFQNNLIVEGTEILKDGVVSIEYLSESLYIGQVDHQNKRSGNGFYRYSNHDMYLGQWHEDCFNGHGKFVFENGDWAEGQFSDGQLLNGKYTYNNGDVYEGEMNAGSKSGEGTMKYKEGSIYQGNWHEDKRNGAGTIWTPSYNYQGNWQNDKMNGEGIVKGEGFEFRGIVSDNILTKGKLTINFKEGQSFEGQILKSQYSGFGVYTFDVNTKYQGSFACNKLNGQGMMKNIAGTYQGEFRESVFCGKGKFIFVNGDVYEGEWVNGMKHGYGRYIYRNGDKYEGQFYKDMKSGKGTYFWHSSQQFFSGQFSNDTIVQDKKKGLQINFPAKCHPSTLIPTVNSQLQERIFC